MRVRRRTLLLGAGLLVAAVLFGLAYWANLKSQARYVSREAYDRVRLGMSREELEATIGRPADGDKLTSSGKSLEDGVELWNEVKEPEDSPNWYAPEWGSCLVWIGPGAEIVVVLDHGGRVIVKGRNGRRPEPGPGPLERWLGKLKDLLP